MFEILPKDVILLIFFLVPENLRPLSGTNRFLYQLLNNAQKRYQELYQCIFPFPPVSLLPPLPTDKDKNGIEFVNWRLAFEQRHFIRAKVTSHWESILQYEEFKSKSLRLTKSNRPSLREEEMQAFLNLLTDIHNSDDLELPLCVVESILLNNCGMFSHRVVEFFGPIEIQEWNPANYLSGVLLIGHTSCNAQVHVIIDKRCSDWGSILFDYTNNILSQHRPVKIATNLYEILQQMSRHSKRKFRRGIPTGRWRTWLDIKEERNSREQRLKHQRVE